MTTLNNSITRGLSILECLFEDGFEGKTLEEVCERTEVPWTTAWRMLKTMEARGWVVEVPISGSKQGRWRVSDKFVGISFQYKRYCLESVHRIEGKYLGVSGEALRNE